MDAREFGDYLKRLRYSRGLTLAQLGDMIGYSNSYLSQIETGQKGIPSPELLHKLSKALDVKHEQLMIKAGHTDEKTVVGEKISFAAKMIVEQILKITADAKERTDIESLKNFIEKFEEDLIAGSNGKDITIPELKEMLWYMEGDGDSMKSTIGKRSESREIEILLNALDNVLDAEYNATRASIGEHEFLKRIEHQEIARYLTDDHYITYNGHPLTGQDKQRILDILKVLFPNYQTPPTDGEKSK